MVIRTTVDIPKELHDQLHRRAEQYGTSIRALVIGALDQVYSEPKEGSYVTGPMVTGSGKLGPAFPVDENPHDLVFS